MRTLELTGRDLVRALGAALVARPAVDAAVRARAETVAAHVAEAGGEARVVRRGHADCAVEMTGFDATEGVAATMDAGVGPSRSHPASPGPLTNSA